MESRVQGPLARTPTERNPEPWLFSITAQGANTYSNHYLEIRFTYAHSKTIYVNCACQIIGWMRRDSILQALGSGYSVIKTRANDRGIETIIDRHLLTSFLIHNRYELMTDCWKEEPCSRPSFFQLIEKLEVIMQRDAPYLDLDKHNEDHPYYNVPPEASGDEEGNMEKEEPQDATSIDSYL